MERERERGEKRREEKRRLESSMIIDKTIATVSYLNYNNNLLKIIIYSEICLYMLIIIFYLR